MYIHVYHFFLDHKTSLPTPAVGVCETGGEKASVESHWHEKVEADGQLKARKGCHPRNDSKVFEMGVSKNRGTPKWMVYNGKPY